MQPVFSFGQSNDLRSLRDRLRAHFGEIRGAERRTPVAQFVYSFIASRTYDAMSWHAFQRLTGLYPSWDAIADAPQADIEAALAGVTFPEKKAPELQRALRKIRVRAGAIDLDFLEDLPVEQALFWLEQIHGVGRKIAAATLNFSTMRRRAFVVDSHVLRLLRRFGFVRPNAATEEAYDAVMAAAEGFIADDLYELHWHLKRLGQESCTHFYVLCEACAICGTCLKRIGDGVTARARRHEHAAPEHAAPEHAAPEHVG